MSDILKTIKIKDLPEMDTIKDDDIFIVENGSFTCRITGKVLADYISKTSSSTANEYVLLSSVGKANGIAPLNANNKLAPSYINFGTETGTVYDGGKGQVLREDLDTHIDDTSVHHNHSNKSVLDGITQAKVNAWDAGTGSGSISGATSLTGLGINATADELNYSIGVKGNLQEQLDNLREQLDGKQADITGAITTVVSNDLPADKVLISNPDGKIDTGNISVAEIGYLSGVSSPIQTQLNGKAPSSHGTHVSYSTTAPVMNGTASAGSAPTVSRSDHVHPSDISKANTNHTQSASTITDGTLNGNVMAKENTSYTDACLRNIAMVTTDPTEGAATAYINGTLICVYE